MLTFRQFNYLMTIVEEGSFTAASEKLFIAQSALSRQIKNMEDELGFLIFDRSEKKIRLTPAGHILYQYTRDNLNHLKGSIELAQAVSRGEGRTLRVAHSSSIVMELQKLKALDQVCENHHVDVEINTVSSDQQVEAVLNGSIDLGFIRPHVRNSMKDVCIAHLYTSPLLVAVSETDLFFQDKYSVFIHELKEQLFVSTPHAERGGLSYLVSNLCLSNGFSPRKASIRSRKVSQLNLVAHGYGICIVPEEFSSILPAGVRLLSITGQQCLSDVQLIWRKDQDQMLQSCADMIVRSLTRKELDVQPV